jgi:hypothetical protein
MRVRCLFCALGCGGCYCRWRWRRDEVMGILGAVEEERRWREVHAGGKGGVEGSGRRVDIINIAGNVCVCVSFVSLSRASSTTSSQPQAILHLGSWHTAADEFNCSIALTYLADPKASPRLRSCVKAA